MLADNPKPCYQQLPYLPSSGVGLAVAYHFSALCTDFLAYLGWNSSFYHLDFTPLDFPAGTGRCTA